MEFEKSFNYLKNLITFEENEKNRIGFSVKEVFNENEADFIIFDAGKKTEGEIYQELKSRIGKKYWWLTEKWKEKEFPNEQIEIKTGGNEISVYNFNREIEFSDKHLEETIDVLKKYEEFDPKLLKKIKFILVNNVQEPSLLGDEKKFPLNGCHNKEQNTIEISPRGMRLDTEHRIPGISNFKGTLAHEIYHYKVNADIANDWQENFDWNYCHNYPDDWIIKKTKNGRKFRLSKKTGVLNFNSFTSKPELCLNDYARTDIDEDICDSGVATFYNPELMKRVSVEKYNKIKGHFIVKDRRDGENIPISFTRIPADKIKLPQVSKEEFTYYKEKPEDELKLS